LVRTTGACAFRSPLPRRTTGAAWFGGRFLRRSIYSGMRKVDHFTPQLTANWRPLTSCSRHRAGEQVESKRERATIPRRSTGWNWGGHRGSSGIVAAGARRSHKRVEPADSDVVNRSLLLKSDKQASPLVDRAAIGVTRAVQWSVHSPGAQCPGSRICPVDRKGGPGRESLGSLRPPRGKAQNKA
jgi:hypothetical protein